MIHRELGHERLVRELRAVGVGTQRIESGEGARIATLFDGLSRALRAVQRFEALIGKRRTATQLGLCRQV
ncbi:hypothetical protein [Burkholderia arboris]|uniref:hypothetical protein n=1 Tax=Burkholderia arboris TaxID=488730 RepID=UPI00158349FE|nr:hypothetical protein [Burkholderia arboris]